MGTWGAHVRIRTLDEDQRHGYPGKDVQALFEVLDHTVSRQIFDGLVLTDKLPICIGLSDGLQREVPERDVVDIQHLLELCEDLSTQLLSI